MFLSSIRRRSQVRRPHQRSLQKFLYYFPGGFYSEKYLEWERNYKWNAHLAWTEKLNEKAFKKLVQQKQFREIAKIAVTLESKTNLLFSFEKMALRDAVKNDSDAKSFAIGLYNYIYGSGTIEFRFNEFKNVLSGLPVKQTRVLTWPLLTVFGFIADPSKHIFLKPLVTKAAAKKYSYDFNYLPKPNWETYQSLLDFGDLIRKNTAKYRPRDMIDIQSFIWVLGSEEYPD